MAAKSSIVVRKTFTLTMFSRLLPAASRTAARFLIAVRYRPLDITLMGWEKTDKGLLPTRAVHPLSPALSSQGPYQCFRSSIPYHCI
ncbi:hypothetical protein F4679DRAFT_236440 [Xylaria curta]|nr:hypothetical protein F4679DRAFT_236440 [Xylaria curta]